MHRGTGQVTEIVGTSDESVEAAIADGVTRAVGAVDRLDWYEIVGVRSTVLDGTHRYRVELRLGLHRAA